MKFQVGEEYYHTVNKSVVKIIGDVEYDVVLVIVTSPGTRPHQIVGYTFSAYTSLLRKLTKLDKILK